MVWFLRCSRERLILRTWKLKRKKKNEKERKTRRERERRRRMNGRLGGVKKEPEMRMKRRNKLKITEKKRGESVRVWRRNMISTK
jgi:hypothetical protein